VVALLVVAVLGGSAVARQAGFIADEDAFRSYVLKYVDGWSSSRYPGAQDRDRVWVEDHMAAVVAEGQRSCDWLRARSDAPDRDPLRRYDGHTIESRYLRQSESDTLVRLHEMSRRTVVDAAWYYLCPRVRHAKTSQQEESD
jgi:hypothetical protein